MKGCRLYNNDEELGAFLLGKIIKYKGTITANIKEVVIPKQEVSKTSVDISPQSMIDLLDEIGIERNNEIIGHYHIHPFNFGETNWSGIDEDKIEKFCKDRKKPFIFVLSSFDC